MPVNSTHSQYDENSPKWKRLRDVLAGEDAVKKAMTDYVPMLSGQDPLEYQAYLGRGLFYAATSRTLDGLSGMISRKDPTVKKPGNVLDDFLLDVDMLGNPLADYAKTALDEVISVGRGGTLVDWNDEENRPVWSWYDAETILNWRMIRIAGKMRLGLVVLAEQIEQEKAISTTDGTTDDFTTTVVSQIRVLRLVPAGEAYQYQVEVWQQVKKGAEKAEWVLSDQMTPVRRGLALADIPFTLHGPSMSSSDVERSPLEDIATANLNHFALDVDYKHGLFFTSHPTPIVAGIDKDTELKVGSTTAWVSDNVNFKASYMEASGSGLGQYVTAFDRIERIMAILGARMLEQQKAGVETAQAMQLRQGGEGSVLAAIAHSLSQSLTHALKWAVWWQGTDETPETIDDETVSIQLNTEFEPWTMDSASMQAMVAAWQGRAISRDTLFWNLQRGGIIPPGRTLEEEQAKIDAEAPVLTGTPLDLGEDNPTGNQPLDKPPIMPKADQNTPGPKGGNPSSKA